MGGEEGGWEGQGDTEEGWKGSALENVCNKDRS